MPSSPFFVSQWRGPLHRIVHGRPERSGTTMFPDLTRDDVFRIETQRLWLRWPCAADADALVELAGDRAVAEMTARIPHPLDRAGVDGFILSTREANSLGRALVMAIVPKRPRRGPAGIVAIEPDPSAAGPHLGYWVGTPYQGRGLATEAACALVEAFFAYTEGGLLTSAVLTENAASRRVLQKCGFAADGTGTRPFPARGGSRSVNNFRLDRRTSVRRAAPASLLAVHGR